LLAWSGTREASTSPLQSSITLANEDLALRLRLPLNEVIDGINPLIKKGFLIPLASELQDASNPHSDASTLLATQSPRDRDRERERDREEREAERSSVSDSEADQSEIVDEIGHLYPGNKRPKVISSCRIVARTSLLFPATPKSLQTAFDIRRYAENWLPACSARCDPYKKTEALNVLERVRDFMQFVAANFK
jgi:hypothetical protein